MRVITRCWVLVCFILLVTSSGVAAEGYRETFEERHELAPGGAVSLENINGDVSIEVWEHSEVRIQAVKTASSQELLDGLEIVVRASGEAVRIDTRYPSNRGHSTKGRTSMEVEYTLTIPRLAVVDDIDLVNGNLMVVGVEGGVHADSVNGTIVARECAGGASLSTVNGGIELYTSSVAAEDALRLESVNGSVDLYLSASAGAEIRAESVNGRIGNDFGLQVHKGKYVGSDLEGTVGGGGARVELDTVNGRIYVHQR